MQKTLIFTGMIIGLYIGSAIPLLWGGSLFSMSSVLLSGLGAFVGIYFAYKFAD
jgi:hypothetical protein